jgi:hypothetical protein
MSEWVVNAQIVSVSLSSDNWVKVLWRTKIEGKEEMISSNFGPDFGLREKFYDKTGVGPKNLSSLEGKVFGVRIYKSSRGKLQASPADLFDPNKLASPSSTLTQPLAAMAKVVVPPTNAPRDDFKKAAEAAKTNPIDELKKEVKPAMEEELLADSKSPAKNAKQDSHVKRLDTVALKQVLKACGVFLDRTDIQLRMQNDKLFDLVNSLNTAVGMEIAHRICK